ncbi:SipW-dependent-type signal peptide-containing protein [Irregularibacter muris]|uniref:SipW-dependent-type signal peptide-containing protein n=1 Tax=Irregularibacter muris TaxID=1796619 RepID=A0AAE3L2U7_9FIRM|nr:SipW-dependent-type signal peptide-containing protein [Irregularibacter muris]MCR1899309.1 SipW-dependent-type signal peptide-containing protein [Irregularibacter muris]
MNRRSLLFTLSVVLCVALLLGVTYAYFTAKSDTKINTFTVSDGISIQLAEPKWDNRDYEGKEGNIPLADLGITKAQNIVPSRIIPKNPSVKNASDSESVWLAIRLDYTIEGESSDYSQLDDFATIDFAGGVWEEKENSNKRVFYYNTKVEPQDNTSELFSKVEISSNTNANTLKPFDIKITAYAVQGENVDYGQAKTELDALMAATP